MIRVNCANTGSVHEFTEGISLLEILGKIGYNPQLPVIAAKVNNVVQGLGYRLFRSKDIEFIDYTSYSGRNVYCRSLCFLLAKASSDVFPGSGIMMHRPISKGYYCQLRKQDGSAVTSGDILRIKARMQEIAALNAPFIRHEVKTEEAIRVFREAGFQDKVRLLETCEDIYVDYYTLLGYADMYFSPLVTTSSMLKVWDISPFEDGILLRVPDRHNPSALAPMRDEPKTFSILKESLEWNRIMELKNVGDVNVACHNGRATDLIQISEALQEKKLVRIAEEIDRRFHGPEKVRLVLITGPSSSGKSTVCKRLSIQLKACGLKPVSFSTDDYFVNRVLTPLLPDGSYDFDNFDTVDHDALQEDVIRLLDGQEVQVPEFNFVTGIREYNGKTLKMEENTVLLIEGIHALNPRLTDKVPEDLKYRIFINAVTSIPLDDHNCIPTSDYRLVRRIVRDASNGSFSARSTINTWHNVRNAEVKWIYPYQEQADVLFNSAYLVEFAVLRRRAERILGTVPHNCPEYGEAYRLLNLLSHFTCVDEKEVPSTSLIRSFIGGGSL